MRTAPTSASPLAWLAIGVAAAASAVLGYDAWMGRLGLPAFAALGIAAVAFGLARRGLPLPTRATADMAAKALFTVIGIVALLRHPIPVEGGERLPIYDAIVHTCPASHGTFALFGLLTC
ncbi:MAG: hypothetical protein U0802_06695 [Candidatus Binatia bacterium]